MLHMEVAREVPMRVVTERCERRLPMRAELEVANERCKWQVQHRRGRKECNQDARMRVSNETVMTNANEMFQGEVQLRALVRVAYQR